jgi:hypothetical protein
MKWQLTPLILFIACATVQEEPSVPLPKITDDCPAACARLEIFKCDMVANCDYYCHNNVYKVPGGEYDASCLTRAQMFTVPECPELEICRAMPIEHTDGKSQ